MNINIQEYLSAEEIKRIISEEIKENIKGMFSEKSDVERILFNVAYKFLFEEVAKVVPDYKDVIKNKTKKCIEKTDYSYYVFDKGDYGQKSLAYKIMEDAVKENNNVLKKFIFDAIELYRLPRD